MEVRDIEQEAVIKTIPPKNKCKKAKWLSEEALQIVEKRREVKGKGEKERYTNMNAGFQRRARRDKKAFLSDQCKEIEENNRMGKTRDLFKKIRDTKGIFHAKMGAMKDRNGVDLTEAKDGKKRWQEYIEEQYRKDLHDPWLYCAEDTGQAPRKLPRDLGRGTPDGFPSLPHPEGPLLCLPSPLHPQDLHGQRVPLGVSLEDRGGPRE